MVRDGAGVVEKLGEDRPPPVFVPDGLPDNPSLPFCHGLLQEEALSLKDAIAEPFVLCAVLVRRLGRAGKPPLVDSAAMHAQRVPVGGRQLDSLSDMVSFGVAPAFLMLRVVENALSESIGPVSPAFGSIPGRLLWLMAAAYICCAALRLARFNVENQPEESAHMGFSGLPSPAAAGVVLSIVLLYSDLVPELQQGPASFIATYGSKIIIYCLPFVTVGVALLMVSRVPYPHVVNHFIRGRRPFRHVVLVALVALFLIWKPQLTMAIGFCAFGASGPIRWLWQRHLKGKLSGVSGSAENTENTIVR